MRPAAAEMQAFFFKRRGGGDQPGAGGSGGDQAERRGSGDQARAGGSRRPRKSAAVAATRHAMVYPHKLAGLSSQLRASPGSR